MRCTNLILNNILQLQLQQPPNVRKCEILVASYNLRPQIQKFSAPSAQLLLNTKILNNNLQLYLHLSQGEFSMEFYEPKF